MSIRPADYPFWLRVLIVITLAMFALSTFFFIAPFVWFVSTVKITPNDIGSWLGSLLATFIGAYLAFRFGIRKSEQERVDKEVSAGNLALSTLIEMWDRQFQFQKDVVRPFRNRPDAWFSLTVGTPLDAVDLRLNRNDVAFVLEADPGTWQEVLLQERRYHLVKKLIDTRDAVVMNEAWPRMVAQGVARGTSLAENELEQILGPAVVSKLREHTRGIVSLIDENVDSLWDAILALRETLRKVHPGRKFIRMERPRADGEPTARGQAHSLPTAARRTAEEKIGGVRF